VTHDEERIAARSYVQGSDEWLFARHGRMTASLAAAALGLSAWQSPQSAYRCIVGLEEPVTTWLMIHGREFEGVAADLWAAENDREVCTTGLWIHPDEPWLAASPDRLVEPDGLLEVKCGKTPYESLPDSWWVQCQVQMMCTGEQWCDVVHYIGGRIKTYHVLPEDHEQIMSQLRYFMRRYVIPGVAPKRGEVPRRCKKPTPGRA
jgi:putative phage-type endonuclease